MDVLYLCDGKIEECDKKESCYKDGGECRHTSDIRHALNFYATPREDFFMETALDLELTEKEKWECTARWLNACFISVVTNEPLKETPCTYCPVFHKKCIVNFNCPQENFKIIEQFTGADTIVSEDFRRKYL